jgi:hypothetical protein
MIGETFCSTNCLSVLPPVKKVFPAASSFFPARAQTASARLTYVAFVVLDDPVDPLSSSPHPAARSVMLPTTTNARRQVLRATVTAAVINR